MDKELKDELINDAANTAIQLQRTIDKELKDEFINDAANMAIQLQRIVDFGNLPDCEESRIDTTIRSLTYYQTLAFMDKIDF